MSTISWPCKEYRKSLKLLILKGVENNYRPDLWFLASGAKREMNNNRGYYDFLVNQFPEEFPSPYAAQIDLVIITYAIIAVEKAYFK